MKLFKKNEKKETTKLPMTGKVRKGFRFYCVMVMAGAMVLGTSMTAFAASDPLTVVNNLSDFIFGLIRAVGLILLGWGIVQVGLSLQSHDPSQRSNGFLTLAGGIVITFAKEILTPVSYTHLSLRVPITTMLFSWAKMKAERLSMPPAVARWGALNVTHRAATNGIRSDFWRGSRALPCICLKPPLIYYPMPPISNVRELSLIHI